MGFDWSNYKVIYRGEESSAQERAAIDLCRYIAQKSGVKLQRIKEMAGMDLANSIVVGEIGGHLCDMEHYGDCKVYGKDDIIYVAASDICGLESGVAWLADMLTNKEIEMSDVNKISFTDSLQEREVYETDTDAFLPCYRYSYFLPKEELTFENKVRLINDPTERSMVIAHRGEHIYYPENSLESFISAYFCGADSLEFDIQYTKDGVGICMHDEKLTRTTNVLQKKGQNGLPDSEEICDWTLEEIRQLQLLDPYGKLTPFLIPTLEETLLVCENRMFAHLDKVFDYHKVIFPIMEKHQIYKCIYLCNRIDYEGILENRDYFKEQGVTLQNLFRTWDSKTFVKYADMIVDGKTTITPALVYINDYYKNTQTDKDLVKQYAGKVRVGTWMMYFVDDLEHWREARSYGFSYFMTNYPIEMLMDIKGQYIDV